MSTKKKAKNAAAPTTKKAVEGPSVRIEYDKEQYLNHYSHMANNLKKIFPELRCFGQKAPPTARGMLLAFVIFIVQATLSMSLFFGETFLTNYFNYSLDPTVSQFIKDYQMFLMIPIVFITPLMQYAARSGAFEIYLNEVLIFSKKETQKLPSVAYVKDLLVKKGLKAKEQ
ncbi:unnamed protein product [Aphanomyces euteiches]|uniref:Uncharacterized protein n=1 Tax=Aphanomyces euteiches TaxID=100861 RepID=A0A6G0XNI9_9STRA|nr:hypothetical protein Ae201684_002913 [Aphanomyces euteiches]KAH9093311.1 hypothetical protein Ae201684P_008967 [Aphanomyces euteiches]KAH9107196.1 hypothetical protein AeMF1_017402 [Aphanomyces euteiches]KAH9132969.1 hypothetical protein LEN26_007230 [Aphanomyces euteiches]KAH9136065.1 hypothetical protein AeRB84_018668 [Aphanomyces euteiches]